MFDWFEYHKNLRAILDPQAAKELRNEHRFFDLASNIFLGGNCRFTGDADR